MKYIYLSLGRHCCLWCTATYADIQLPLVERGRCGERTLETLKKDYQEFVEKCGGNISRAKEFHNVIQPYILDIPLDKVQYISISPSNNYAHLCIFRSVFQGSTWHWGYYDRLWDLLEGASNCLDLLLAKYCSGGGMENSFEEYVCALKKKEQLERDLTTACRAKSHCHWPTSHPVVLKLFKSFSWSGVEGPWGGFI